AREGRQSRPEQRQGGPGGEPPGLGFQGLPPGQRPFSQGLHPWENGATPAGGESGGRRTVRLRGGRAGTVTHESLRGTGRSYQPVRLNRIRFWCLPLCCRIVGTSVESASRTAAAFFDLDKTIISRSSTLAFVPSFYRHGLITRSQAIRG